MKIQTKKVLNSLERIIPLAIILIAWIIGSKQTIPLFLPGPELVFKNFIVLFESGLWWDSLVASFTRITTATLITTAIALPIGLLVSNYKWINNLITPVTGFMRFMPPTAFYALLIAWVGIGEKMKITFLVLATIFYFLPSVIFCIKEINEDLIDTARTMGMNKFQVMMRVMLPAALPAICENFLVMYGIGWTYVIIAEVIDAQKGIGHIINLATARSNTAQVFVMLFTILIVAKLFDAAGNFIIRKAFKWRYAKEVQS